MGLLRSSLLNLRTDPRLLKVPPYISLLCILGGIVWILLLPLDEYSRRTYISENALLPGQVHTYYYGSEQNVFRAYWHEVSEVLEPQVIDVGGGIQSTYNATVTERNARIRELFANSGIKSATQPYTYTVAGKNYRGENVYGINHAPRGDGTESILLVAPIINHQGQLNTNGVTLLLGLARYFSRWSLWSKDIIFLVTEDTTTGPQAWIDAYFAQHDPKTVASLPLKSGLIQAAVCIDFPFRHSFHALHISYDGVNGQLPNLDLINTASAISQSQANIPILIQQQHTYSKPEDQHKYPDRLRVLLNGMRNQAVGQSTGAHSVFMPYHIDAITLTSIGDGREDEMAFGRVVESLVRSVNNLLEKLHQSFFFYLVLQNNRFVSIGTYLPSAMTVAASFTVMAIYLWIKSGYEEREESDEQSSLPNERDAGTQDPVERALADPDIKTADLLRTSTDGGVDTARTKKWKPIDRELALPFILLTSLYLSSLLPITLLTHANVNALTFLALTTSLLALSLPFALALFLSSVITRDPSTLSLNFLTPKQQRPKNRPPQMASSPSLAVVDLLPPSTTFARVQQFFTVTKSLALLVLGLELTVLATLNFSLSLTLGVLCSPLAFAGFFPASTSKAAASVASVYFLSPPVVLGLALFTARDMGLYSAGTSIGEILGMWLETLSFGWNVLGAWGVLIGVFCVWLPAWVAVAVCGISGFLVDEDGRQEDVMATVKGVAKDTKKGGVRIQQNIKGSVKGGKAKQ